MPTRMSMARLAASEDKSDASYKPAFTNRSVPAKKPPTRATRKQVTYKYESEEESEEESEAEIENQYGFGDAEVVEIEKKPVFTVFEAKGELENGLCIIRSLGGDKYELVNLSTVPRGLLGCEETGGMIKGDEERRGMFAIDKKNWEEAKVKAEMAVKSADGHVFRLLKLPLELRYRIYEFALMADSTIFPTGAPSRSLSLALLRTNHQVYREAIQFFHRNNFRLTDIVKNLVLHKDLVVNHVQEITFEWWGYQRKDHTALTLFSECTKLKVLHIIVTRWVADPAPYHKRQRLFQGDASVRRFSRSNGFDELLAIRGLEKVTVQNAKKNPQTEADVTDEELAALETLLMRELTQPKPIKPLLPLKKRKGKE